MTDIAPPSDFEAWIAEGQRLAAEHRTFGFRLGDWLNHGRRQFPDQCGDGVAAAGVDKRQAQRASTAARLFPPQTRQPDLSFDHHRAVVKLGAEDRHRLLAEAALTGSTLRKLKEAVVQFRYETGDLYDDQDIDTALLTVQVRAWNRATPEARKLFLDLAETSHLKVIDEDKPCGA